MFEDYKKDLRDLFQKFHDDGLFGSLYDQLSHGNHYVIVKYTTIWDERWTGHDTLFLCYLYDKNIYFNRNKFIKSRGSLMVEKDLSSDILDNDLFEITRVASNTFELCSSQIYDVIDKADTKYKPVIEKINKSFSFYPEVCFYSYDILLFDFDFDGSCSGLYEFDEKRGDKLPSEIIKTKIKKNKKDIRGLFYNIRKEYWFDNLEDLTKDHINGFYNIIENTNFEKIELVAIDYSPFLSPLWKATEVEFDYHYKYYYEDIVKSAEVILVNAENSWSNKMRKRHGILIANCRKMVKERGNFKKGGLFTAYLVLFHLALGKELQLEEPFETSYLNKKQFKELKRNSQIISDLNRDARNRNIWVHQEVLSSKTMFRRQQNLLMSIINILAILKEYKELD